MLGEVLFHRSRWLYSFPPSVDVANYRHLILLLVLSTIIVIYLIMKSGR